MMQAGVSTAGRYGLTVDAYGSPNAVGIAYSPTTSPRGECIAVRTLIVILLIGFGSWHVMDLGSDSVLHSLIAPFVFFFDLIAFGFWLALVAGVRGRGDDIGGGGFGGDSGFGDSGGCSQQLVSNPFGDGALRRYH